MLTTLVDARRAAKLLGTAHRVVRNAAWRRRVGLRAIRVGRSLRFDLHDVAAIIERGRETFGETQAPETMAPRVAASPEDAT